MKRRAIVVLAGLLTVGMLTGCGAAGMESADNMAMSSATSSYSPGYSGTATGGAIYEKGDYDAADVVMEESEKVTDEKKAETSGEASADVFDERKLIKTVDMDVETKEYDLVMSQLQQQIKGMGGYIENMDTYNGSSYYSYRSSRYANMTIRIPKDKLDSFLETVSGISNVVRRSDNVEDVTLSYVDMESRRDTLRVEQDRLLELLQKAKDINDIIVIEERLSSVRYQLESMESQLRTIDNQVDYSTVKLNISEVKELTPVEEQTVGERIVEGFSESLKDIGTGAVDFSVWFVVNIPYFIIWAVIITVVVLVIKKCRKNKSRIKHKEKKAEEQK